MVAKAMGTTGTASPPVALGEDGHPGGGDPGRFSAPRRSHRQRRPGRHWQRVPGSTLSVLSWVLNTHAMIFRY